MVRHLEPLCGMRCARVMWTLLAYSVRYACGRKQQALDPSREEYTPCGGGRDDQRNAIPPETITTNAQYGSASRTATDSLRVQAWFRRRTG